MTVLVVGGGVAGLVAARAAAARGERVTLIEADDVLGGSVRAADLAGVPIDIGAESVATKGADALRLISDLGLRTTPPRRGGAWLQTAQGAVPLPAAGVLGIPSVPLANDVRAAIGTRAAIRAYLDTVRPELRVGKRETLGSLVERRMGRRVLDVLVRPVVEGVYGVDPEDADADALAPGLTTALARAGSLAGAVATLRSNAPAGAAVAGIVGGVHLLVSALADGLRDAGVEILTGARVDSAERVGGGWRLTVSRPVPDDGVVEGPTVVDGELLVVATGGAAARRLLAPHLPSGMLDGWPAERASTVVALAVDDARLDAAPRGTGVLVAEPEPGAASALTHSTAKWPWLAETLPSGRHIVRLTYRGAVTLATAAQPVADASRIFGFALDPQSVAGFAQHVWVQDAPRALTGVDERIPLVRAAVREGPELAVTGSWLSGTGLAAVIADAETAAL